MPSYAHPTIGEWTVLIPTSTKDAFKLSCNVLLNLLGAIIETNCEPKSELKLGIITPSSVAVGYFENELTFHFCIFASNFAPEPKVWTWIERN